MKITRNNELLSCSWMIQDAIEDEPEAAFIIYEFWDPKENLFSYYIRSTESGTIHHVFSANEAFSKEDVVNYCIDYDIFTETYYYL